MHIDAKKERQLKITLSAVEICDYFGSFKDICYSNKKARAALGSILLNAMDASDFKLEGKRLVIKVFPTSSGGCTIYFILRDKKRFYRTEKCYIYEFSDCEDMLLACEQIEKLSKPNTPVSLYSHNGIFRLIIDGKYMCKTIFMLGPEYSTKVIAKSIETQKTKEHWHKICVNTPVNEIIKAT